MLWEAIMTDKIKNYTKEQEARLMAEYATKEGTNQEFVTSVAGEMGKTVKSVIAKLVSLGVYKTEKRTAKNGAPIVTKAELVSQIEAHFGFEVPSLVKATKTDLQHLADNL